MKHDDFTWDDIILEAPGDEDLGGEELTASDYSDAEGMDIEEGEPEMAEGDEGMDEDPADEDPLSEEETDDEGGEEDPADEDPLSEDPADEDPLSDDGTGGEGYDENLEDEQTDNTESDVVSDKQNINLVNDFIELYTRIDVIMQQIRTDCKTNIRYNPNMLTVRRNLEKLKDITYDYIVNKFTKETYVANLYQFNLIIQALNTNIDLLASVLASNRKFNESNEKKKKANKKEDKKKH